MEKIQCCQTSRIATASNTLNHVPSSIYPVKYLGNEDSIKKNVHIPKQSFKTKFYALKEDHRIADCVDYVPCGARV